MARVADICVSLDDCIEGVSPVGATIDGVVPNPMPEMDTLTVSPIKPCGGLTL
jgi:hypothetical protein